MIKRLLLFSLLTASLPATSQIIEHLTSKVTLGVHPNIETYFIAEKLAVQHIGNYVFSQKDSLYAHQPMLYFAYRHFKKYENAPCILRIAELLQSLRDTFNDNAQTLQYLLYQNSFPQAGELHPFEDSAVFRSRQYPTAITVAKELTDSLRSFFKLANVGAFLKENKKYYLRAIREVRKDIREKVFANMEAFYGEKFEQYALYIMPLMPITTGEDNYRAFGPTLYFPGGRVSVMVFSSSRMVTPRSSLAAYTSFGFDNPEVTHLLTVHEIGHSFVNPHVLPMETELEKDTALFTPALKKALEASYISNWQVCVVEHLVRLGEIRIAVLMKDSAEVNRLRKLHIDDFKFVLLPLLEDKIKLYESERNKYPDFNSFLPELFSVFHNLTPADVNALVSHEDK